MHRVREAERYVSRCKYKVHLLSVTWITECGADR